MYEIIGKCMKMWEHLGQCENMQEEVVVFSDGIRSFSAGIRSILGTRLSVSRYISKSCRDLFGVARGHIAAN